MISFKEVMKGYIGDPEYKHYRYFFAGKRFYLDNIPKVLENGDKIKFLIDQFNFDVHVKLSEEGE